MDAAAFTLPVTERQIAYARSLALKNQSLLPWEVQQDRRALGAWIETQAKLKPADTNHPTSKQVAFAERLARIKRRAKRPSPVTSCGPQVSPRPPWQAPEERRGSWR